MGNPFPWGCVSLITTAPLSCLILHEYPKLVTWWPCALLPPRIQTYRNSKPQNQQLLTSFSIWKIDNLPFFFSFKVISDSTSRAQAWLRTAPYSHNNMQIILISPRTLRLTLTSKTSQPSRSLSQDRQSALCWLFGGVQSSLKCTSNGSLILHPCDVTVHLTNTIRGPCSCFFFFFCCPEKPCRSSL